MKKEKRKEILEKYAYLKNLDLEGFLWELIRRNKDYQKAYKKYRDNKSYWLGTVYEPPKKKNENELDWSQRTNGRAFHRYKTLFNSFGLEDPIEPSKQADDEVFKKTPIKHYFRRINRVAFHHWNPNHNVRRLWSEEWMLAHKNSIEVNINVDASIDKVKEEVERIIKTARKGFKKSELTINQPKSRFRKERIQFLIAYDLKDKDFTIRDINKIIYPNTRHPIKYHVSSECSICRKIFRHIEAAKKLINERYHEFFIR